MLKKLFFIGFLFCSAGTFAQKNVSKVWVADNGDGTYKNPIINADYSDPDAIRVGNDFYIVSSSFEDIPGFRRMHGPNTRSRYHPTKDKDQSILFPGKPK